jgi:long-chain acyl-CoA synthetase
VQRYRRWLAVNPLATVEARAAMLGELWGTYRLDDEERAWPDTRIRFFRQTVFETARPEFGEALEGLMAHARAHPESARELGEPIAAIRSAARSSPEEDWLLARMAWRHLRPEDDAALISRPSGDGCVTDVVVGLSDADGGRYSVREPISAREVARLLQIFHDANLPVTFGSEHEFLLAVDGKQMVIGGIYWRPAGRERAHLEKIVVARAHRRKGVSDGLMAEFMRRLRGRGIRALETGYFHPQYFRRFGFGTDSRTGGLLRDLSEVAKGAWDAGGALQPSEQ